MCPRVLFLPQAAAGFLTFDSTNHRALDKVFLDERIYADDRHSGEDDAGSFQNFGIRHSNGGNTLGLEAFTRGNNQVIQFELQRAQRDILFNVVQRIGVGIPTANCIEQGDGCMMGLDSGTTIFARMVK